MKEYADQSLIQKIWSAFFRNMGACHAPNAKTVVRKQKNFPGNCLFFCKMSKCARQLLLLNRRTIGETGSLIN